MIKSTLLEKTACRNVVETKGCYSLIEYEKDMSVSHENADKAYFASQMNVRKRQVLAELNGNSVVAQAGAMQLMLGDIQSATDVKGGGDLLKKMVSSAVTKESAIKPKYSGNGTLVLEPTFKYIIFEDLADWNGKMSIEDGMFLACDGTVNLRVTRRSNISSALLGGQGLFNTALEGSGVVVLESSVPRSELIVVDMESDVLKIDGNMAIAWSDSLEFTVERTTKTLIGSAASGEGLVNVYRGTGRVLIAPAATDYGTTPLPVAGTEGIKSLLKNK